MSFALGASGQLYAWGSNANGEQGTGGWGWSGPRASVVDHISDCRVRTVRCRRKRAEQVGMCLWHPARSV